MPQSSSLPISTPAPSSYSTEPFKILRQYEERYFFPPAIPSERLIHQLQIQHLGKPGFNSLLHPTSSKQLWAVTAPAPLQSKGLSTSYFTKVLQVSDIFKSMKHSDTMETRAREKPKIDGRRKLLKSLEKSSWGRLCLLQLIPEWDPFRAQA